MHPDILRFARRHQPTGACIDVGAYNVNGALSDVWPITLRVDMRAGPGVDRVLDAGALVETFGPESWDNVASAEMLEHAEDWRGALGNMWAILKPGGLLLLTMASRKKGRHAYPDDYWRFDFADFLRLFAANQIIDSFDGVVSIGALVRKSGPLDLTCNPHAVP